MSDSWRERALPMTTASKTTASPNGATGSTSCATPDAVPSAADLEALLTACYGLPHIVPVHRGRLAEALLAEALLAKALIRPGATVVTNAVFPTTRFHLESAGALVLELGLSEADDLNDPHPFKGELDLDRLAGVLAGEDGPHNGARAGDVGAHNDHAPFDPKRSPSPILAIYIELGANAIGGYPVRLSHLRAVRDLAADHGEPVLLDAAAFLPHLGPDDHRATELANALFLAGGVERVAHTFRQVFAERAAVAGLRRGNGGGGGMVGALMGAYGEA